MRQDILKLGLDPIIHFEAIARLGSLKLAASELGISQPAVTQSLKKLEASLEVNLCTRGRSSFALTESGKRLFNLAKEFKLGLKDFENFLENKDGFDGLFSIGVLDNIQNRKFEATLENLVKRYPKVKLNIQSYTANEIQNLVSLGELDVGVGVFNQKRETLTYTPIGTEKICHYISDRHLLWKKRSISKKDVTGAHVTWSDMISRDRRAIEIEIFSRNKTNTTQDYASYANNLNATVFILRTGISIVSLPEGHIESKKLDFKYKQLNSIIKPFLLQQEVVFRDEFSHNSLATKSFIEMISNEST